MTPEQRSLHFQQLALKSAEVRRLKAAERCVRRLARAFPAEQRAHLAALLLTPASGDAA